MTNKMFYNLIFFFVSHASFRLSKLVRRRTTGWMVSRYFFYFIFSRYLSNIIILTHIYSYIKYTNLTFMVGQTTLTFFLLFFFFFLIFWMHKDEGLINIGTHSACYACILYSKIFRSVRQLGQYISSKNVIFF